MATEDGIGCGASAVPLTPKSPAVPLLGELVGEGSSSPSATNAVLESASILALDESQSATSSESLLGTHQPSKTAATPAGESSRRLCLLNQAA